MAKRVNTKFVFYLTITSIAFVMLVAGLYYVFVFRSPERMIANAEEYLAQGNTQLAADAYRKALIRRPNNIEVIYKFCDTAAQIPVKKNTTAIQYLRLMLKWSRDAVNLESENTVAFKRLMTIYEQWSQELGDTSAWGFMYEVASLTLGDTNDPFQQENTSDPFDPNAEIAGESVLPDPTQFSEIELLAYKYRGLSQVNRFTSLATDEERNQPLRDLRLAHAAWPEDVDVIFHMIQWHLSEAYRIERPGHRNPKVTKLRQDAKHLTEQVLGALPDTTERLLRQGQAIIRYQMATARSAEWIQAATVEGHRPSKEEQDSESPEQSSAGDFSQVLPISKVLEERVENQIRSADIDNPIDPKLINNVCSLIITTDREGIKNEAGQVITTSGYLRSTKLMQAAIEAKPNDVQLLFILAHFLTVQNKKDEAMPLYDQIRSIQIAAKPFEALLAFRAQEQAMFQYTFWLLKAADDSTDLEERNKDLDTAEKLIRELETRTGKDNGRINLLRGTLLLAKGEIGSATTHLDSASNQLLDLNFRAEALMLSAKAMTRGKQLGAAADRYQQLLDFRPKDLATRWRLAQTYLRMNELPSARTQIDMILKNRPDNRVTLVLLAEFFVLDGQPENAIQVYKTLDALHDPQLLPHMMKVIADTRGREEALRILKQRFEEDPSKAAVAIQLLKYVDDPAQSDLFVATAIEAGVNPDLLNRTVKLHTTKESREQLITQHLENIEDDFERHLNLSLHYQNIGNDAEAESHLEKAIALDPDNDLIIERQFHRALREQDWDFAQELVDKAKTNNTDAADGHFYAGQLALARNDLNQAVAQLKTATDRRPIFAGGWAMLGDAYAKTGELANAEVAFQNAIDNQPDNIKALMGFAGLHTRLGNKPRALELLRKAHKARPTNNHVRGTYLGFEEDFGNLELALKVRKEVVKTEPQAWGNRRATALLLARMNRHKEAIETLDQIIEEQGPNTANMSTMAQILYKMKRIREGLKVFKDYVADRGDKASERDWTELARLQWQVGLEAKALASYREAMAVEDPKEHAATIELAKLMMRTNKPDQAAKLFRRIWGKDNNNTKITSLLAETLIRSDQLDEAESITEHLKSQGMDGTALMLGSLIEHKRGNVDLALRMINQATQLEPNRPEVYLWRAELLQFSGPDMESQVQNDLTHALDLNPSLIDARRMMSNLRLRAGETREAISELETLLKYQPRSMTDRRQLADLYTQTEQWLPFQTLIAESVELFPQSALWPLLEAGSASRQGDFKLAAEKYKRVFELAKTTISLGDYANALIATKQYQQANQLLRSHAMMVQAMPFLLAIQGHALVGMGQGEQATATFQTAYNRCEDLSNFTTVTRQLFATWPPDQTYNFIFKAVKGRDETWIHIGLAEVDMVLQKYDQAFTRLTGIQKQVEALPEDSVDRAQFNQLQGLAAQKTERHEDAQAAFERILERDPDNVPALNNLAYLLADGLNKPHDALPLAEKAANFAPRVAGVLDTLGWIQFLAGNSYAAAQTLQNALAIEPLAPIYFHLGEVYMDIGQDTEAINMLQEALKIAEKSVDLDTASKAKQRIAELQPS